MNREPIYHKDTKSVRIVSVANDQWRVQERNGIQPDKTQSGWDDIGPAFSQEGAITYMYRRYPPKA